MLDQRFVDCIVDKLKEAGFGKKRAEKLLQKADGMTEGFKAEGLSDAEAFSKAQARLFDELRLSRIEKMKAHEVAIARVADGVSRVDEALASGKKATKWVWDGGSSRGAYAARALVSMISDDPRFRGDSMSLAIRQTFENLASMLGESLDKFGKGILGGQKGMANERDFVRAMFGDFGGAQDAVAYGRAFKSVIDYSASEFKRVGGAMKELEGFHMPDPMTNKYSIDKAARDGSLLKLIKDNADLAKMRRADGRPLPLDDEKELDKILLESAMTKVTNGVMKEGGGRSAFGSSTIGNNMEKHRFFIWKDADAWMSIHKALGEGTAFDRAIEFIRDRAHDIGAVKVMGRSPKLVLEDIINEGEKRVAALGLTDQNEFNAIVEHRLKPMFDALMGHAIPDQESHIANTYGILASLVRSADLQAAPLIAMPSDQIQSVFTRHLTRTGNTSGLTDLLRYFATRPGEKTQFLANMGYINDAIVETLHASDRFSRFAEVGPYWSRSTSNAVMRLNGMTHMTEAARQAFRMGTLVDLAERLGTEFEKYPGVKTLEHYNITKEDWDLFRKSVVPVEPQSHAGAKIINMTQLRDKGLYDLYSKMQSFIIQESYNAVPDSSLEAHIILTGGKRADTLVGALTNSFSMFKNMSIYIPMLMGRQLLASDRSGLGKAAFMSSAMAALALVGSMKLQLQEVTMNARTLRQPNAEFWVRSLATGGGLGFMGDAVFGAADSMKGRGLNDMLAGAAAVPVEQAIAAAGSSILDGYKYLTGDMSGGKALAEVGHQSVQFMQSVMPGTFYTKAAMQRYFFDKLDQAADPVGYAKRQKQKESMLRRRNGNEPLQFK